MAKDLDQLLAGFDSSLPLERASTLSSRWYYDSALYELEQNAVFPNAWHLAARIDQCTEIGSFVTLDVAGEPVLIARGQDSGLRAFHNVCRHRAARVVTQPCGVASKFQCRYHGWTYDLQGNLRGLPEWAGVEDFCKEEMSLRPISIDTLPPFVFVRQAAEGMALEQFLGPFVSFADDQNLSDLHFAERRVYPLRCNWKVFVDNFQDGGYHVNTVHKELAGTLDYKNYRTDNFPNGSVQISPLKRSVNSPIGKVRTGEAAYYWWIFPNLMINVYEGVMDTNIVIPTGPETCEVWCDFYFQAGTSPDFIRQSIEVADQVQHQDREICEEVQRGLHSRTYDTGRFSVRRESGGYHFHQLLAKNLRG